MRRMLETIRKTFGLCTCAVSPKTIDKSRGIPKWHSCFDDYLQNCSGDWPLEEYREAIEKVERLLTGKTEGLMRDLKEEMAIASDALPFEKLSGSVPVPSPRRRSINRGGFPNGTPALMIICRTVRATGLWRSIAKRSKKWNASLPEKRKGSCAI